MTDPPASPRLVALQEALHGGEGDALAHFWAGVEARGTPLVEPAPPASASEASGPAPGGPAAAAGPPAHVLLTFLWRGGAATENVLVLGPFGGRELADRRMARLEGTDVWHRTERLRADVRTVYRLAENDSLAPLGDRPDPQRYRERTAGWRPDPLNRDPFPAAQPWASGLVLPGAPPQPWVAPRPGVPAGRLEHHRLPSAVLGNERDVTVYTPPGYEGAGGAPSPLVLLFDRGAYLAEVPTPTILDNLTAAGRLPPVVAVLVGNPDQATRNRELPCHPPFVRFLTEELLPWARGRCRVTDDPARTVVGGSSYGGLAAAFAALERPDVFGNVLSQSGSYSWTPEDEEWEWLLRRYAARERLPLRFYLDVGLLEDDYAGPARPPGHPGQLGANRHLRTVLRAKGYPVRYAEFAGGHDYLCWRGTLADGLLALLGRPTGEPERAAPANG